MAAPAEVPWMLIVRRPLEASALPAVTATGVLPRSSADNVLWSGRVLPGHGDGSAATQGVTSFTRLLFAHPGFDTTILPVRDGVAVAVRL